MNRNTKKENEEILNAMTEEEIMMMRNRFINFYYDEKLRLKETLFFISLFNKQLKEFKKKENKINRFKKLEEFIDRTYQKV